MDYNFDTETTFKITVTLSKRELVLLKNIMQNPSDIDGDILDETHRTVAEDFFNILKEVSIKYGI